HQVRHTGSRCGKRVWAVAGYCDPIASTLQVIAHNLRDLALVLDDQDLLHTRHSVPRPPEIRAVRVHGGAIPQMQVARRRSKISVPSAHARIDHARSPPKTG